VWTPTLPRRDEYEVYARWPAAAANASDAPYTIYYEGGSATVTKNQQATGNSWQLLGSFVMAPGQSHRVELTDTANGNLIADAVKFVPKAAAKTATWTVSVATTGSYKLYAKWPASSAHATDAQFTVTHASGTTTVTANQRLNGGQWNLLGTYSFNSGNGYKVELSDQVAAGKVAADAIYIAGTAAPAAAFTWTPAIPPAGRSALRRAGPSAGSWRILVRWPASSGNTGAARYTVTHAGGTTTVTLNQKQNGGIWNSLGTYSLTPGAGHKVTLAASTDGTTIADALLFAGPTVQPANLLYIHADHLGSPQKLTNTTQAIAWDGVFDPFGEEVAITGLAAMPLRFPGQYADDETGFRYNFFRDYDPGVGRYVESDPIGLRGGINTYVYVDGNPIGATDELGLSPSRGAGRMSGSSSQSLCLGGDNCEEQMYDDQAVCRSLPNKTNADKAIRARCWASVSERYAACKTGRPLPPLVTWREDNQTLDPGIMPNPGLEPMPNPSPPSNTQSGPPPWVYVAVAVIIAVTVIEKALRGGY